MTDKVMQQIQARLLDPGWIVIAVGGNEAEPSFAYTIGLWQNYRHPEIIVKALTLRLAHVFLNQLGERVKAGAVIALETRDDSVANYPAIFRQVKETNSRYFGLAQQTYGNAPLEAIQLVWSDKQGKFPWELEFSLDRRLQLMKEPV